MMDRSTGIQQKMLCVTLESLMPEKHFLRDLDRLRPLIYDDHFLPNLTDTHHHPEYLLFYWQFVNSTIILQHFI